MSDSLPSDMVGLVGRLVVLFAQQGQLLDQIPIITGRKRIDDIRPLVMGIGSNVKAIALLAYNHLDNEVFVVLRSLLERMITFHYLQACSDEEFAHYRDYSQQKTIWKMNQSLKIKEKSVSIRYMGEFDLEKHPQLSAAKKRYTSRKGKPLTRWSQTTIVEKLELIEEKRLVDPVLLMMATVAFYDDGSEALHATLYGCLFHFGILTPGVQCQSAEALISHQLESLMTVFFISTLALGDLCQYVCRIAQAEEIHKASVATRNEVIELMKDSLRRT